MKRQLVLRRGRVGTGLLLVGLGACAQPFEGGLAGGAQQNASKPADPSPSEIDELDDLNPDGGAPAACFPENAYSCLPGWIKSCYDGAPNTIGVGPCAAGTRVCNLHGTAYGPCLGQSVPLPDDCVLPTAWICGGPAPGCGALLSSRVFGAPGTAHIAQALASGPNDDVTIAYLVRHSDGTGELRIERYGATLDWARSYPWESSSFPHMRIRVKLAADTDGNVILAGTVDDDDRVDLGGTIIQAPAGFVAKLDAAGQVTWTKVFPPADLDWIAPAVGQDGTIVVVGQFGNIDGPTTFDFGAGPLNAPAVDGFILKLDAQGAPLWSQPWGSSTTAGLFAVSIDEGTNILVSGFETDGQICGYDSVVLASYNANGMLRWKRSFPSYLATPVGSSIATTADGSVYVAGRINDIPGVAINFGGDALDGRAFLAKFSADGDHIWSKSTDDAPSQPTIGGSIAVDAQGNVFWASPDHDSPRLRKFDPGGRLLWDKILPATPCASLEGALTGIFGLAVQSHGEVTMAGGFGTTIDLGSGQMSTKGETDAYLVSFSP